ncbi:MAG: hypothetical protein RLZZ248_1097 [Bacteroidota bacterium]
MKTNYNQMKTIFTKIKKVVGANNQNSRSENKNGIKSKEHRDLYNAELMPSGFFDTYQKILFRPGRAIEEIKNE